MHPPPPSPSPSYFSTPALAHSRCKHSHVTTPRRLFMRLAELAASAFYVFLQFSTQLVYGIRMYTFLRHCRYIHAHTVRAVAQCVVHRIFRIFYALPSIVINSVCLFFPFPLLPCPATSPSPAPSPSSFPYLSLLLSLIPSLLLSLLICV